MKKYIWIALVAVSACKNKVEKIKPTLEPIAESVYASGIVKSKNQYQAFANVNGIVAEIYVNEGDSVKAGEPILTVSNDAQRLNKENAELNAAFSDFNANQGKLNDARMQIDFARNKMKLDSALYFRQKNLWSQSVGTETDLEQKELNYQNSKTAFFSANVKYNDLKRQLKFTSSQSRKNLEISSKLESDYTLRSEITGIVYDLMKSKGEIVGFQTPLALIGDPDTFTLEMQVDEYDIIQVQTGQMVLVTFDSYKGQVFEARVTKIDPMMNERSKTFEVEAEFIDPPKILYPNMTFEANIVLQTKDKALLIPRNYMLNDSTVVRSSGEKVLVKTGLKDYQKIEILSGIHAGDELIKPVQ